MTYLVFIVVLLELSFDFPSLRMTHYIEGFTFSISSNLSGIYFISIPVNLLLIYWLWIERRDKQFQNKLKLWRISNLKEFLNHNNITKTENLIDKFGGVFDDIIDIYYIKNYLILKTCNLYYNGVIKYPGYYLETNYFKYFYIVKIKINVPILLDRSNFTNIASISTLIIMTIISIFKLTHVNILN